MDPRKVEVKNLIEKGFTAKEIAKKVGMSETWVRRSMIEEPDVEEDWECICPSCGIKHVVKMHWSGGDFIPRVRCEQCKRDVKKFGKFAMGVLWK